MQENIDLLRVLHAGADNARCGIYLHNLDGVRRQMIYQNFEVERLQSKYITVRDQHERERMSWSQIAFNFLIKYMGDMANRKNYLELASRVDLSILHREHSLRNIEGLLIGAAGLLSTLPEDDYARDFINNGNYLLHKYQIEPMGRGKWQGATACKAPIIRLSQIAQIIHKNENLFNRIVHCRTRDDIFELCSAPASPELSKYFGSATRHIGVDVRDVIGINTIVPLLYAYGFYTADESLTYAANDLNEALPAERNGIINSWRTHGLTPTSAYESQALIEIYEKHCKCRKCDQSCHIFRHMTSSDSILERIPAFTQFKG